MNPEIADDFAIVENCKATVTVGKSLLQNSTAHIHNLEHFVHVGDCEFSDVEIWVGDSSGLQIELNYVACSTFVEGFDHDTPESIKKFAVIVITHEFEDVSDTTSLLAFSASGHIPIS